MRVFVTGGTGLIGRRLVQRLVERGDQPIILSRRADDVRRDPVNRSLTFIKGDPAVRGDWASAVDGCDAVVNLAGHNIFSERWNSEVKRKIRDSRVYGTENLVAAITNARSRPSVLVQGSAIGYYGSRGDEELTEESPPGSDFMAVICREWEEAAHPVEALGVRLARIRTGIVLARGGGPLAVMTPIFKLGPGAPIGGGSTFLKPASGKQWMSWIHLEDIVGLLLLALDRTEAHGPINGTAPNPVRNSEFSKALSKALWKPYAPWRVYVPFGPPDILLGLVLGQVAQIITTGQRVLPAKAQTLGYQFKFPLLEGALQDLFAEQAPPPAPPARERKPVASGTHHH